MHVAKGSMRWHTKLRKKLIKNPILPCKVFPLQSETQFNAAIVLGFRVCAGSLYHYGGKEKQSIKGALKKLLGKSWQEQVSKFWHTLSRRYTYSWEMWSLAMQIEVGGILLGAVVTLLLPKVPFSNPNLPKGSVIPRGFHLSMVLLTLNQ